MKYHFVLNLNNTIAKRIENNKLSRNVKKINIIGKKKDTIRRIKIHLLRL